MDLPSPSYRCRSCGATSYQPLVHRDPDGAMRYSGVYKCSGCPVEFTQIGSWRERRVHPRGASTEPSAKGDRSLASSSLPEQGDKSPDDAFAQR